jgi:hypothetical protein
MGVFASRRWVLTGVALVSWVGSLACKSALPASVGGEERIPVRWHLPRDEVGLVVERLRFDGRLEPDLGTASGTRGLPAIYVLIGLLMLPKLIDGIVTVYRKNLYGGVVSSL